MFLNNICSNSFPVIPSFRAWFWVSEHMPPEFVLVIGGHQLQKPYTILNLELRYDGGGGGANSDPRVEVPGFFEFKGGGHMTIFYCILARVARS